MKRSWLALVLLAACSDPMEPVVEDPCAPVFACRSEGVDLEVVSVIIASASTDSETGLPIVHPPSFPVEVTIRNRGTDTAAAGTIDVMLGEYYHSTQLSHSELAPGASFRGSVTIPLSATGASRIKDDRMTVQAAVWSAGDSIAQNNQMLTGPIHVAIPLLDITFTTATTAFAGQPIELTMVVRNYGQHAASPARTISACLFDGFRGCEPSDRTTAGSVTIPMVAPGAALQIVRTMTMAPTGAWQDAAGNYGMYLCEIGMYQVTYEWACFSNGPHILVRPSYDAVCAPPTLTSNAVALAAYNCGHRPTLPSFEAETQRYRFHIVSLDAQANATYGVQRSDTSSVVRIYNSLGDVVHDFDPHPERIRVAATEKIYLVMYTAAPALTISAAPVVGG